MDLGNAATKEATKIALYILLAIVILILLKKFVINNMFGGVFDGKSQLQLDNDLSNTAGKVTTDDYKNADKKLLLPVNKVLQLSLVLKSQFDIITKVGNTFGVSPQTDALLNLANQNAINVFTKNIKNKYQFSQLMKVYNAGGSDMHKDLLSLSKESEEKILTYLQSIV